MAIKNPVDLDGGFITGLQLSNNSTTSDEIVDVSEGICRDSTNLYSLVLRNDSTVDITESGAGGLDTGTVANNTLYSVYLIGDSSGANDSALILSTNHSGSITFPSGYDIYRRLGSVRTDGTADILTFDQRGKGRERTMWYRSAIATDITNGNDAAWAAVDVSGSVPVASITGLFRVAFDPTAGNDTVFLRSGDSSTDAPQATMSGSAAGVTKTGNLVCPIGATLASGVDYEVIGSATAIDVQGYVDEL